MVSSIDEASERGMKKNESPILYLIELSGDGLGRKKNGEGGEVKGKRS